MGAGAEERLQRAEGRDRGQDQEERRRQVHARYRRRGQADGKVVGTCDGGTKKIVYKRG
jgi:hypothetical protein